tara:strand:+ start:242 stop:958 length:717 start_codon:yes stop_codon:yes gene_type:complete
MKATKMNAKAIKANRKRIFKIEAEVMTNKANAYISRSMIEENRLMILSNYSAAFMGNRQLANSNTDEIFENRKTILENYSAKNDVEENFINAQKNKASLDFLKHRSDLNTALLKVSEEMANVNSKLVEINKKIMDANQSIVDFNAVQIAENKSLINGALKPQKAKPASNAKIIKSNSSSMKQLEKNVKNNRKRMTDLYNKSEKNAAALMQNKSVIKQRRNNALGNRAKILANKSLIKF